MRLRENVCSLLTNPEFLLGRGHDLLFDGDGICANGLRRSIFDQRVDSRGQCKLRSDQLDSYVRHEVRRALSCIAPESPLVSDLVTELADESRVDVGRYLRIAVKRWHAETGSLGNFPEGRLNALLAIGLVSCVAVLHKDLPNDCGPNTWGRGAMGITLADSINAKAMELIYTLPAHWSRRIASELERFLALVRNRTLVVSSAPLQSTDGQRLMRLAFDLGRPCTVDLDASPPAVLAPATSGALKPRLHRLA